MQGENRFLILSGAGRFFQIDQKMPQDRIPFWKTLFLIRKDAADILEDGNFSELIPYSWSFALTRLK